MKEYRVSLIVNDKTHIYDCLLTQDDQTVAPRCKPSVHVDKSNTKIVNYHTMKSHVKKGYICPYCLRYKADIIINGSID